MKPSIIIIDDEVSIGASLKLALKSDYHVRTFTEAEPALQVMENEPVDLVLLDLRIGSTNGLDVLRRIKVIDPRIPVIIITAYGSIGSSVEAMRCGAFTYLTKPLDLEELQIFMRQATEFRSLSEEVSFLTDVIKDRERYDQIVGTSEAMEKVFDLIDKVKNVDTNVLITGESGTGKELVARAIHESGSRQTERFVVVNCAAIPQNLLEIEFFGYKKGSFTGAMTDRKGKFEVAHKGTIFLDEIGDMPIGLQGKLLRVLQDKVFTPVGSSSPREVDVRVVAATNKVLEEMIEKGLFREDLYYRLKVMEIRVPPLRDRMEDLPLLSDHFLKQFSRELNKPMLSISDSAAQTLQRYSYPGNVRQLANILEYAAIVTTSSVIEFSDFPEDFRLSEVKLDEQCPSLEEFLSSSSLADIEKQAIKLTLKRFDGKREMTADQLGISRRTLQYKLKEYNLF